CARDGYDGYYFDYW
nr:immunoglobulin heavy chain junction region [Mus musculus]